MFKDLRLYNNNKLKLPNLPSFDERLKYLKKNLFSIKEYRIYYGFCGKFTPDEDKSLEHRRLGVKRVGSDQIDETIKNTLDYLTTYLLSSKEFDARVQIRNCKSIDDFLYCKEFPLKPDNQTPYFFVNKKVEGLLINSGNDERYKRCKKLKTDCLKAKKEIKQLEEIKTKLFNAIEEEYKFIKTLEDKELVENSLNIISKYTDELKQVKKEIGFIEIKIRNLYSEYVYITEWR